MLSGLFGFFASLTRNTGVVLVFPFLYEYFRARDFQWKRIREDVLAALMIPGGLVVYMGLLDHTLGDPLAFIHAQEFWKRSFHWPWETVWYGTRELWVKSLHGWTLFIRAFTVGVVYAELLLLALPLLIPRLRIPVSFYLFALGSVVVPLLSPSKDWYFLSISRFALVLFPLFLIAARAFRHRWLFVTVAGASVAGLLFCLANFSKGYFVA